MRGAVKSVAGVSAVLLFAAAASSPAPAQDGAAAAMERAKAAEASRRAGDDARRLASWELKLLEQRKAAPRQRDYDLTYAQISEDYRQIQLVNNGLARAQTSGKLDAKGVDKSVAEIRRRAARLRENMALPEPEKKATTKPARPAGATERVDHLLITLDNLVMAFVTNPLFEQGKVVDVKMSMKARADLEEIIEVSDRIAKAGEKSKVAAQKTQ